MNVFDIIPSDFFNCLAGNSNNRVYADCLELIHNQYDKEISYRLERSYLRDVLAAFLLENHLDLTDEENTANAGNDEANFVLRKFISVGWLEEDQDDSTFEKYIVMTDNGIALAEFLHKLKRPATPEFSSYILNIYNRFNSKEYANKQELYNFILKPTFSDAKALSSDLKKLSTSIKKIIEKMNHEGSLESLTENIISYCDGDFIKEYSRLVHQQNIHIYRNFITRKLDEMKQPEYFNLLCTELSAEEKAHKVLISNMEAEERVYEMIDSTKKFLHDDYNKIMDDIKLKINTYIHIAIARERMLRNKGLDIRGVVEQTLRILISSENSSEKEELGNLFNIQKYEYVDQSSVMYPHKSQQILHNTESEYFELSKEEIERQKYILEQESHNPYSKDEMKKYMESLFRQNKIVDNSQFNYSNKEDILKSLAAVSYAKENGYLIETDGTYIESENYITKHWRARKNIQKNDYIDTFNVLVTESNGKGAFDDFSSPVISELGNGFSDTFLAIGTFNTRIEAENALKYIKTKFARAMLGIKKATQHNPKSTWTYVPLQDFTSNSDIDWSKSVSEIDKQLYRKYRLSKDEIEFIESKVREM